jgi:hypothetical protein
MANAERNQNAPQLTTSARLDHAEHIADAVRTIATRSVTQAPHAIEPIELLSGQAIEIAEATHHASLHQLGKQLLTDTLKVECTATNRISQRLKVLRRAGAIWAAMAHLIAYDRSATGWTGRWHGELWEWRGAALRKSTHHLRNHIARLLQHDDISHAHILATNLIDVVQRRASNR